jgi:hypothetical protein
MATAHRGPRRQDAGGTPAEQHPALSGAAVPSEYHRGRPHLEVLRSQRRQIRGENAADVGGDRYCRVPRARDGPLRETSAYERLELVGAEARTRLNAGRS